jgi:hypothetical protein
MSRRDHHEIPSAAVGHVSFDRVYRRVQRVARVEYGVPIRVGKVPPPFTGDLNGREVMVDDDEPWESRVFLALHLFGHTVQWNLDPETMKIGAGRATPVPEAEIKKVHAYEAQACRYGLALLHRAGVDDLDGWFSDYATCDYAYLVHYYRTGETQPFRGFWRHDSALVRPLAIPAFKPKRVRPRSSGVVL